MERRRVHRVVLRAEPITILAQLSEELSWFLAYLLCYTLRSERWYLRCLLVQEAAVRELWS